jgi:hypothetical protein
MFSSGVRLRRSHAARGWADRIFRPVCLASPSSCVHWHRARSQRTNYRSALCFHLHIPAPRVPHESPDVRRTSALRQSDQSTFSADGSRVAPTQALSAGGYDGGPPPASSRGSAVCGPTRGQRARCEGLYLEARITLFEREHASFDFTAGDVANVSVLVAVSLATNSRVRRLIKIIINEYIRAKLPQLLQQIARQ